MAKDKINKSKINAMAKKDSKQSSGKDARGKFAKGNTISKDHGVDFGSRPENRSNGHWRKEDSYSYQLRLMDRMTVADFKAWIKNNPEATRTMAQEKAYHAQVKSRRELTWLKEVTDRTEGKAPQNIDLTTGGEKLANTFEAQQAEILLALKNLLEGDGVKSDK